VKFTDTSTGTGISAGKWDFNIDETVDSTVKNSGYSFSTAGSYTVNPSVTGLAGSDGEIKTNFVQVMPALVFPDASFTVNTNNGTAPLAVTFTDISSGTDMLVTGTAMARSKLECPIVNSGISTPTGMVVGIIVSTMRTHSEHPGGSLLSATGT